MNSRTVTLLVVLALALMAASPQRSSRGGTTVMRTLVT